jgi:hypothetical protein
MKKILIGMSLTVALLAGCSSSSSSDTTVASESADTAVSTGDVVEINLIVHGYDISTGEMAEGQEAVIEFVASNAGTFDIESHVSEEIMLVLTVE